MEEKAVNNIMKILTQDGMTTGQAKSVLQRVQLIFSESSKNFLDQTEAREVLRTPCRYDGFRKSADEKKGSSKAGRLLDWITGMGQSDNDRETSSIKELAKLCASSHSPEHIIALRIAVSKFICSMETDRDFRLVFEYDSDLVELKVHRHYTKDVVHNTGFDNGGMTSEDAKTLLDWIAYADQSVAGKSEKTGRALSNLKYPLVAKKLQQVVNMMPDLIWNDRTFQMVFIFDSHIGDLKIDVKYDPKQFLKENSHKVSFNEIVDNAEKESIENAMQGESAPQEFDD